MSTRNLDRATISLRGLSVLFLEIKLSNKFGSDNRGALSAQAASSPVVPHVHTLHSALRIVETIRLKTNKK